MILALLPVRNAAQDLLGYFQSVSRFADGVLALDDGSTDETPQMLRQEKLVRGILHNPPREGFAGWDDAANRNRLLAAAADFDPEWILSLDADERIDEADGRSLRKFLQTDALPGLGYGFRCYPTSDDGRWFLPSPIWVYRLFHYERGQRFPDQRFHFAPIPTTISREAYLRTTFRIQHLGGFDNARRAARYEKYRDADPDRRFWPSYSALLAPVEDDLLLPWPVRSTGEPTLLWEEPALAEAPKSLTRAVVVLDDNARNEEVRTTLAVLRPAPGEPFETIFVGDRKIDGDGFVSAPVPSGSTRGVRLQAALEATTSDLLIVLDAGQTIEPADLSRIWRALAEGYGVARCVITARTGGDRERRVQWLRSNWPDEPGELGSWRPVGYRRDALAELGPVPELARFDRDAESFLIRALARRGVLVGRVPATIADRSPRSGELSVAGSRAAGNAWAEIDLALAGPYPAPARKRAARLFAHLRSGRPEVPRAALAFAAAGYAERLVLGRAGEGWAITGWPSRTIGFVGLAPGGEHSIGIAQIDLVNGRARVAEAVPLPNIPVSERIDERSAHHLRDQLELSIGAPVDDVVLFDSSLGNALTVLRNTVRRGGFATRLADRRDHIASTMTSLRLAMMLLRLATFPDAALTTVPLDADLPIGAAVIVALQLPAASSMRDRLRNVTWA